MRSRHLTIFMFLLVLVAACTPDDAADTSTTRTTAPAPTTTTVAEASEAVLLSYTLEPGASFTYEVEIAQTIDMTSTGDPEALGDEEIPGEMSVEVTGTTVFTYTVAEGAQPDTYEVHIFGEFTDLEVSGTIDGEPVPGDEIPDLAEIEPVDVVLIVDEQGNIIPEDSEMLDDLFGGLGGLGMLDQMAPGASAGQFVGPPFSEDEVTVGDTWSETISTPTMPGEDPITTEIISEIVGTETIDGSEVFVIDTTTTTSKIEFDLAELLLGFLGAFVPDDATEEELAEMDALADQLRFAFTIDETVGEMTTWFDFEAGYARQADVSTSTSMVFDINMPDETTGDLVAFGMDMDLVQDVSYRLSDSGDA